MTLKRGGNHLAVLSQTSLLKAGSMKQNALERVRNLTAELEYLCTQICSSHPQDRENRNDPLILAEIGSSEDILKLRAAMDQLRRVLWFYEEKVESSEIEELSILQSPVTQLSEQRLPDKESSLSGSFFERLNLVIDGYMQPTGIGLKQPGAKRPRP